MRGAALRLAACLALAALRGEPAAAYPAPGMPSHGTITDRSVAWPSYTQWRRVVLLQDYNTRVVLLGTMLLGCASGLVGSFTLLRKRALMGDALSHAALPGIGLAFITATYLGGSGKSLGVLLAGATLTGLAGVGTILLIRNLTRLKEDTAMGVVLSVYFGAGVALLGVIQQMKEGHAAGLEAFVYGKTASMRASDTWLIGSAALVCVVACLVLFKELKLLCFDEGFAASRGIPVVALDAALMALVVTVTIVGLQAVGLILMVALLVIPAAAARFWTDALWRMFLISGALGAGSGLLGAAMSALFSKLPSGAMIVLVCSAFFLASLVFGPARGLLARLLRRRRLNRSVDRQHLLRALYEILEASPKRCVEFGELISRRSWSPRRLGRAVRRAQREGLLSRSGEAVRLTDPGMAEAARLTRQHRLWELFLITYADVAPGRVDREADAIEHVLEPELVAELESLLNRQGSSVPQSPHAMKVAATHGGPSVVGGG